MIASNSASSSEYEVSIRQAGGGVIAERMSRQTVTPSPSGSRTSRMATWGRAVGMAATYVFYSLRVDAGWPTALSAAVAVLGVGPVMGVVIDRLLLRRLVGAPSSSYVVVSLGLLVALQGFFLAVYGAAPRRVEPFLPQSTFRLPGVNVGWDQAALVVIAAVSGLGLVLFFRTRFGVLTRAVVDDRDLSQLARVDAGRVTSASWVIGCAFAALSGVLLSPILGVDAVILTST